MACKEVLRLWAKQTGPAGSVERVVGSAVAVAVGAARRVGPAAPVVRASRQYPAALAVLAPRAEAEAE